MEIYNLMKMGLDATELRSRVIANNIANIVIIISLQQNHCRLI